MPSPGCRRYHGNVAITVVIVVTESKLELPSGPWADVDASGHPMLIASWVFGREGGNMDGFERRGVNMCAPPTLGAPNRSNQAAGRV